MLSFKIGTFITGDKITEKLLKVYKRFGINKRFFLNSINEWYDVKRITRIINDEKISGYLIVALSSKLRSDLRREFRKCFIKLYIF